MLTIVSAWALGCKGNRDESNGVATQALYRYFLWAFSMVFVKGWAFPR